MTGSIQTERLIIGASIGDCVHVAGIHRFMEMARSEGYRTRFLGPATPVKRLVEEAAECGAAMVAVSYRLSPEAGRRLLGMLKELAAQAGLSGCRLVFGGTGPVCKVAEETGMFEAVFSGSATADDVLAFLRGDQQAQTLSIPPQTLVERIRAQEPRPLLRHHFGQPTLDETVTGIRQLAKSGEVDIVSIGPDQNAQAHFLHPEEMDASGDGAGGVPIRTAADLRLLYQESRTGNHPLLRCYSGTRDILQMGKILVDTIHNAWCAVPLSWYGVLDGRGSRPLLAGIREAQEVMAWHGSQGIPVEVNEAHQWSLRGSHDAVAVATAYIAAHNARRAGVRDYVAQFMFNTPPQTSFPMDLAKMLAKIDLVSRLVDHEFTVWRMVRSGLASFPEEQDRARGQLAVSTYIQMAIKPHIVHVVGYSEADHAATADDIISSCRIASQVIDNCLAGMPDMSLDPLVEKRRQQLVDEAGILLQAIKSLAGPNVEDPLSHAPTLVRAITAGYLDAPDLVGNPQARGQLTTVAIDGAMWAVDHDTGRPLTEDQRLQRLA